MNNHDEDFILNVEAFLYSFRQNGRVKQDRIDDKSVEYMLEYIIEQSKDLVSIINNLRKLLERKDEMAVEQQEIIQRHIAHAENQWREIDKLQKQHNNLRTKLGELYEEHG